MTRKNPAIIENINLYNDVIRNIALQNKNVQIVFPLDSRLYKFSIYEDGYHPNEKGHELVTRDLISILCQTL